MKHLLLSLLTIAALGVNGQVGFKFDSVEKLPDNINSPYEESSPLYDEANDRLYFTRALHPDNKGGQDLGQDLWFVDMQGDSWGEPSNDLGPVNNYLNNAAIGISESADELYLVSTYIKKIELQTGFSKAMKDGENWTRPEALDISLNTRSPYYGGSVNPELNTLIISMESANSKGEEDLYVSFRTEKGWSKPKWLGDSLNSEGYEISPYLFDDGKTLMFASNGMGGKGDCDIFYAYRKDTTWTNWTTPKNAGDLINSEGFDAFPYAVGSTVYFASNRNDSLSNLYKASNAGFYKDADPVRLVFDWINSRLPNAGVEVYDMNGLKLGTFYSDYGKITTITGLKAGITYRLKPSHSKVDITKFDPFTLNLRGDYIQSLSYEEDGTILFQAQEPSVTRYAEALTLESKDLGMHGIFEVDRVPMKNVLLALKNENGDVVQYAVTGDDGSFAFEETNDSLDLGIEVMSNLNYVKNNGIIYYTDPTGRKLFKAKAGADGLFKYEKLDAQQLTQLSMLQEQDSKLSSDLMQSKGVFSYEDLPQDGVTLALYDENNNLVETVVTDENGQFVFTKLRPDQNFSIRPESEDLQGGSLSFIDSKGNSFSALTASGTGFQYEALDADIVSGLIPLDEIDDDQRMGMVERFVFTVGLFNYQNLPKQGVTLRLLDENDNVIETVVTDGSGHFAFSMLKADQKYRVQIMGMEDSDLEESELYFVDKNGNVTTALLDAEKLYDFNKLHPDHLFSITELNEGETGSIIVKSFDDVYGLFEYQELPKEGVRIELYDHNDKLLEVVYTDAEGAFTFTQLAKESKFFVRIGEEDQALLQGARIELRNSENELLEQGTLHLEGFSFKTIARPGGHLAEQEAPDTSLDLSEHTDELPEEELADDQQGEVKAARTPMIDDQGPELSQDTKNELMLRSIYFNFNSIRLSNNDRYNLNHSVYLKTRNSGQPILIVGYSCDLGGKDASQAMATQRANEVKQYLINLGLDPERMVVEGVGATNEEPMTYGERLESRRVDIYHLGP